MEKEQKLNLYQIFWYFLILSVVGLFIETIYCYATTGVLESRKGLLLGPFCPVYGVSGVILIIALNRYQNKNIISLFFYGFIIGSIAEYILSFILETVYGMRFWDYGYNLLNLNGRICLQYSIYWGILSIIIIKCVKPILDKIYYKIPIKVRSLLFIIIFIFLIFDCFFTIWGINTYQNRVVNGKINKKNNTNYILQIKKHVEDKYFTNERMSKVFPNLRIKDEKGNEIWVKTLIEN